MKAHTFFLAALLECTACGHHAAPAPDTFPTGTFTITLTETSNTCGLDPSSFQTASTTMQISVDEDDDYLVQLTGNTIIPNTASDTTLTFTTPDSTFNVQESDGSTCSYDEVDDYTLTVDNVAFSGSNQAELTDPTGSCNSCVINYAVSAVQIGD